MRGNGGLRHGTRGTGPGRGGPHHPRGRREQYGTGAAARGMECWRGITGRRKPREVDAGRGSHRNSAPAEDGRGRVRPGHPQGYTPPTPGPQLGHHQ